MALTINTNISSLDTQKYLNRASASLAKSTERLSSGYKINKAADDAAGISIALKLNVKAAGLSKALDNSNQGIAMLQSAESGLETIGTVLTRLKEIATQAASANTTVEDRQKLYQEQVALHSEIDKVAQNTKYGATALLMGGVTPNAGASLTAANGIIDIDATYAASLTATYSLTVGPANGTTVAMTLTGNGVTQNLVIAKPVGSESVVANFTQLGVKITVGGNLTTIASGTGDTFTLSTGYSNFQYQIGDENKAYDQISAGLNKMMITAGSAMSDLVGQDISTQANAQNYLTALDSATSRLNTERSKVGAAQNQMTYHNSNITTMYENTMSSISTIKDTDMAAEMANFTKAQVLNQAGVAMLAQANQIPQMILSLMK